MTKDQKDATLAQTIEAKSIFGADKTAITKEKGQYSEKELSAPTPENYNG